MRILFVTEYFPHDGITGGVEARTYYLSKHLAENHEISVICSWQEGQPRESEINNCKVYRVGREYPYTDKGSLLSRLSFARAAREKGRELDFDLVDGQSFLSYLPAYSIAKKAGKRKVATYHETWISKWVKHKGLLTGIGGELWERMTLGKDWDQVISVSEFTKNKLAEHGVNPELIKVIPNGVELSEFEKIKIKKSDKPTICTVSRLTKEKRADIVMKAFEKVNQKILKAQLKIIGDGPEFDNLKELSKNLNADIGLLGYMPNKEDVIKIMKNSRLFVSASTLEGFGMTVIESAASRTPFVVSDIKPHMEITKGEKGGLVFERGNVEDLTEKILKILEDKELYDEKRRECLQLAREYNWTKIAEEVEEVYQNLL